MEEMLTPPASERRTKKWTMAATTEEMRITTEATNVLGEIAVPPLGSEDGRRGDQETERKVGEAIAALEREFREKRDGLVAMLGSNEDDCQHVGFDTPLGLPSLECVGVGSLPIDRPPHVNQANQYPQLTSTPAASVLQPPDSTERLATALASAIASALSGTGSASGQRADLQRGRLRVGRYDGHTEWETYWTQFQLIANAEQWTTAERAVRLAAALEGDARRVLLDLSMTDMENPQAIARAVERQFGDLTSPAAARYRFNRRVRRTGEKLGVYAAELRQLARKAFPEFDEGQRFILAKEAFISGLTPHHLRQQVRLSNPPSWEDTLERAREVEQILEEGLEEDPRQSAAQPPRSHSTPLYPPTPERQFQRPAPDTQPPRCWNCGQRGHIQYHCPATLPDSGPHQQPPGNGRGTE